MGEMREAVNQIKKALGEFSHLTPEQIKRYRELRRAVSEKGALDSKQKELIAVALSVAAHCKWCIALHVEGALNKGVTKEEILEAAWEAVLMGGGPALAYSQFVLSALEEFS